MANVDAAFGLRPLGGLDGSPYNGATITCVIPSGDGTATFIGDPVRLTTAGVLVDGATYPGIIVGVRNANFFGVVTSFAVDPTGLENNHRVASTERVCQVVPALDALFAVQASTDIEVADIGATSDFTVSSGEILQGGSTVTGLSGVEFDSAMSGANCILMGVYNAPDNDLDTNNPIVIVRINETSLRGVGAGV